MTDSEKKYFDLIASGYQQIDIGATPARKYSELFTVLELLELDGSKTVLELACSDGYFSREIMKKGAKSLLGVDLAPKMIELAKGFELLDPLNIEYLTGDIFHLEALGSFDIVFTPFVMSYAKNRIELLSMCKIMFERLKPGGQFLSMNDHPDLPEDSATCYRKYGKIKHASGPLQDGTQLTISWLGKDKEENEKVVSFNCYYFSKAAFLWALEQSGFINIHFHDPKISPVGLQEFGEEYWHTFIEKPLVIYITATKPNIQE